MWRGLMLMWTWKGALEPCLSPCGLFMYYHNLNLLCSFIMFEEPLLVLYLLLFCVLTTGLFSQVFMCGMLKVESTLTFWVLTVQSTKATATQRSWMLWKPSLKNWPWHPGHSTMMSWGNMRSWSPKCSIITKFFQWTQVKKCFVSILVLVPEIQGLYNIFCCIGGLFHIHDW